MIRRATAADLDQIMEIISHAVREMQAENVDQWNDGYPALSDFRSDAERGELYVDESDQERGRLRGVVCINRDEPEEYGAADWSRNGPATVVHRLAVDPAFRNQGVARGLLRKAEELAAADGSGYVRSDTYSLNVRMNALFVREGYVRAGTIRFPGRKEVFVCYDKVVG
jgi:GNAT superfamily N-acetyltransferase